MLWPTELLPDGVPLIIGLGRGVTYTVDGAEADGAEADGPGVGTRTAAKKPAAEPPTSDTALPAVFPPSRTHCCCESWYVKATQSSFASQNM